MDEIFLTIYVLIGFLLRIGVPLGLTLAIGWYLRRLDARWREEARHEYQVAHRDPRILPAQQRCWQFFGCSEDLRAKCPAYLDQDKPCWEVFRLNGAIRNKCRNCNYRRQVLVPVGA